MQPGRRLTAVRPANPAAVLLSGAACLALACAVPAAAEARAHHGKAHRSAGRHAEAGKRHAAPRARPADPPQAEAVASPLRPLSPRDARLYSSAFAAVRDGRFADADRAARGVSDPLLLGRVAFEKYMAPGYAATYEELADWLEKYGDQPEAERIYALARPKKPSAAPAPRRPDAASAGDSTIWGRVESLARRVEANAASPVRIPADADPDDKGGAGMEAARDAFYKGDVEHAYRLAVEAGERWIAGLAAFRLQRYEEAQARLGALAVDEAADDWVRSAAGYWAARSAIAAGAPEQAPAYLQLAARTPYTFYGLIAERELGLDPAVTADGLDPAVTAAPRKTMRTANLAGPDGSAVAALIRGDKRARRAAAYAQLGMKAESGGELRAGLLGAADDIRQDWTRLGLALNAPISSPSDLGRGRPVHFDIAQYPTPDLNPDGGFTVDKALVYALVRQESKFNADASGGGAWGLMQLTPATAARVAGDSKLKRDPRPLKDPAFNLRLGQDYVARLLGALNGDLLHAVAAYNSGPGVIQKTLAQLGKNADSLLALESMPGAHTRDYVQKVVAGYWIYRNIFGQDSPTLDAAASSKRRVPAILDKPVAASLTAKLTPELLGNLFKPGAGK